MSSPVPSSSVAALAPFDRVFVVGRGSYDVNSFLELPLTERVTLILERSLTFYRGEVEIPRNDALRWLRDLRARTG